MGLGNLTFKNRCNIYFFCMHGNVKFLKSDFLILFGVKFYFVVVLSDLLFLSFLYFNFYLEF